MVTPSSSDQQLLEGLRALASAGALMTLRELHRTHKIDPAALWCLAAHHPELLDVSEIDSYGDHRIRSSGRGPPDRSPSEPGSEQLRPEEEESLLETPPAGEIPEEPDIVAGSSSCETPEVNSEEKAASVPTPIDPSRNEVEMSEEEYRALIVSCGGPSHGLGSRRQPSGYRGKTRVRKPLVDINTGESLELKRAGEAPHGRKRYDRESLLRRNQLAQPAATGRPQNVRWDNKGLPTPKHLHPQNKGPGLKPSVAS